MNRSNLIFRKVGIFILFIFLLVPSLQTKAQDDGLANDELLIKNMTRYQVTFFVRKGNADWGNPISLASKQDRIFKNVDQIWINNVHVTLQLKLRYYIEYDAYNNQYRVVELGLRKS